MPKSRLSQAHVNKPPIRSHNLIMTTNKHAPHHAIKQLLPTRALLLLAGFGLLIVSAPTHAALIFEAGFDSANIVKTGGSGALNKTSSIYTTIKTDDTNPLGQGSYLHVEKSGANSSGGYYKAATFTPTSSSNSWGAMSSIPGNYLHLNGGADLFFRVNSLTETYANWFRPIDTTDGSAPTNGALRIYLAADDTSTFKLTIGGGTNSIIKSDNTTASSITLNAALAITTGTGASTNHIGFIFSTSNDGWITASIFGNTDGGAIDTSKAPLATATFKINASVVTTGLSDGAFSLHAGSNSGNKTSNIDYDLFRLYDSAPSSFSAIAIPEPASTAVLLGILTMGIGALMHKRARSRRA